MNRLYTRASVRWITVAFALLIAACATTGKYEKVLNSWMGSDVNMLIASWGPPSNEYVMPNGLKMYTWLQVGDTMVVTYYNQFAYMSITNSITNWCKTTFTVTPLGVVERWRWEGNTCRSK